MPPFFPNRRNVSPSQNFLAIDSETRYRNSKNLIKPGHPSIFLYGIRCSIFHDMAQQSTRDHRGMLPASQRHSRVSFRPSNARLSAAFPHHLPLTPHSKCKCWSTRAFHRGLPRPSSHSHGHAGKSATLNENRNTISLAEKINKAIYLCEQKSEERTEPAAPTLSLLVWYLPPSDATIWCSTDLVSGYGHSTVASWFVSSAFISLRYIYWCAQATQVQTLVPQDKGLNSVLPHFTCLAYKGEGWSLHPSSYLPPIRGKKTTMSSGCHVI